LLISGNGLDQAGGNLVAFNTAQWAGDYTAAGVTGIRATLRNLGEADLAIRLLVEGPGGAFHTRAVARLPVGSGWHQVDWPLEPAEADVDAPATLAGVTKLRILHAPTQRGAEPVAGALGVDDITALSGDACLDSGFAGADLALCRAYCDVLGCLQGGPVRACARIAALVERRTGTAPACEFDRDRDGVSDADDNCPNVANGDQTDVDSDGVGDVCDNCPDVPNLDQADEGGAQGVGDACDCPCFGLEDALAIANDPVCDSICVEARPTGLDLTALQCAVDRPDYSAVVESFTDFGGTPLCQFNDPTGTKIVELDLAPSQIEACRANILDASVATGLVCQ
jgi:hypothetical protein